MGLTKGSKKRSVLFCGDVGIPECRDCAPRDNALPPSTVGKSLAALLQAADTGDNSVLFGMTLLRHAATGESLITLGCDPSLKHAASLDAFVQLEGHSGTQVSFAKAASGKYHSLLLLTVGQTLLLSPDSAEHATAITLGAEESATGIQDIAAGVSHFVLCTDVGSVYTFGWSNEYGQLGDGTVWRVDTPKDDGAVPLLTDPKRIPGFGMHVGASAQPLIIACAAGDHHSVLLSASRTAVYTCGRGHRGQLGIGMRKVELQTSFHNVKSIFGNLFTTIAAAGDHTLVLLDTGKVIALGDNTTGAAGTGATQASLEPEEAKFLLDTAAGEGGDAGACSKADASLVAKKRHCVLDEAAMLSIKAPYGTPESYLYPRRIRRLQQKPADSAPQISWLWTSALLTIAVCRDQTLYSAGLLQRPNLNTERADALGHLGRPIARKADSRVLGHMTLPRSSTASDGGWRVICGNGFAAFLDASAGKLRFHGRLVEKQQQGTGTVGVALLNSFDRRHCRSYRTPVDDSVEVNVGSDSFPRRRVVAAVAVRNGMMLVVED